MPNRKTGQTFPCMICGEPFYRRASYIRRGIRKTCGKPECKSASMSGENNPFWGRGHDEETLKRISASKRANPPKKKTGPPKGYKHTPEARAKITEALKERWCANRDKMLAITRQEPMAAGDLRYRRNFTDLQRKAWVADACAWCGAKDGLELDHIIPVCAGGTNERRNAQTLCRACNIWKMVHVDRPLFLAGLGSQGGRS